MFASQHTTRLISRRARLWAYMLGTLALLATLLVSARPTLAAGTTYYVDCAGSDSNNGKSEGQAWKTLAKANRTPLRPGDSLLLKRGCMWAGSLKARWNGTADQPILIGAYGEGDRPLIENSGNRSVDITGSYQIIEYLATRAKLKVDPNCNNQPIGWAIGFDMRGDAAYNTLRYSQASGNTAGVRLSRTTHHNKVIQNELVNNVAMNRLDKSNPNNDLGAWGILVNGNDSEIAYNYLSGNNAICSYDFSSVGNAIELYEAQRTVIHHNRSVDDRVFSEVGGSGKRKAEDNVFAYNVHTSTIRSSRFLVVRGNNNKFGPVLRTEAYNNTVYLPDRLSQGVVCSAGCRPELLKLKNNIIWAEKKALYADGPFEESNNIYWSSNGDPFLQLRRFSISSSSRKVNPKFISAQTQDFHLQSGSPAINNGNGVVIASGYNTDMDSTSIPQGNAVDIGAFEYFGP